MAQHVALAIEIVGDNLVALEERILNGEKQKGEFHSVIIQTNIYSKS